MLCSPRVLTGLAAVALVLAACSSATPTPSAVPSQTQTAVVPSGTATGTGVGPSQSFAPGTTPPDSAAPETEGPGGTPEPGQSTGPAESPSPSTEPTGSSQPTESPQPTKRPHSPPIRSVTLGLEKVADGFDQPNGIVSAGDDRLFVAEQAGRVYVLKPNADGTYRRAGTFLDVAYKVVCCGEQGFLGIAFPPDYATSGKFYITYATNPHNWVLEERRVSKDDPDRADPSYARKVIRLAKPYAFHWGGDIAFGPDGYLWIGMGDGGFVDKPGVTIGDPDNRAQNLGQLWGKMLRIDPKDPNGKGGPRYGIPSDNPYVHKAGAAPEIWARGFRNPWRWSFDRLTGDLWIADVGHDDWEEIDRAKAPDLGKGANYGWRRMEGPACYNPKSHCDTGDLTAPLASYPHGTTSDGYRCATTGGFVYRGSDYPAMRSRFLFGDYCSGSIFSLDANGPNHQQPKVLLDTDFTISTLGEDANGELYLAEYTPNGAIYRITGKPGG